MLNKHLICPKDTDLYEIVKRGFQISDTPVENTVFDKHDACEKRCQAVNENGMSYKHVVVEISDFSGYKNEDNGGALYLVNTGVSCIGTAYKECSSSQKGGGAIFLYNKRETINTIEFFGVKISSCSAVFGGGAYVYSKCKESVVTFKDCIFKENTAMAKGDNDFSGSGAIYLTVAAVNIINNVFINYK